MTKTKLEQIEWNNGDGLIGIVDEGMAPLLSFIQAINGLLIERDQETQFHTTLIDVLYDMEEKAEIIIGKLRTFTDEMNKKKNLNLFGEVPYAQAD